MKNHVMLLILTVCMLMLFTACAQIITSPIDSAPATAAPAYRKITSADGRELLESGTALTLVDVRRADEYETTHIPGAINIPNESIEDTQPDALPDLDQTIVVYCRTGVRSKQVADKLVEMGYTDVRDMGGIADWPYDTVSGTEPGEYIGTGSESDAASTGLMGSFSAEDVDGNDIDQDIFEEYDLTMVNVWATYCSPCISEMPELGELADEYESKGVRIVGMVTDVLDTDGTVNAGKLDKARGIIERTGADYTHIIPSVDLYGLLSQITAVPTTFFVDADGAQVGSAYLGSKSKTEWADIIEKLLEEFQ